VCKWRFPLDIVSSGGWHQRPQQFAHPFRYEHEYETSRIDTIATEQKGEKTDTLGDHASQIKTVWTEETGRMLIAMRRELKEGTEGQEKRIE